MVADSTDRPHGFDVLAGRKRRRQASRRLVPLACGCADEWSRRHRHHHDPEPSQRQPDAYRQAAEHLLALDLPPAPDVAALRSLWRRGGNDQRLAVAVAERWELAG